jgi:hypothetical protein
MRQNEYAEKRDKTRLKNSLIYKKISLLMKILRFPDIMIIGGKGAGAQLRESGGKWKNCKYNPRPSGARHGFLRIS